MHTNPPQESVTKGNYPKTTVDNCNIRFDLCQVLFWIFFAYGGTKTLF